MIKRKDKGITLIALVITIIVLLILAGVSINAVLGDNGILKQAKQAKEITEDESRIEEIERMLLDRYFDLESEETIDRFLKSREGKEIDSSFKIDIDGSRKRINVVEKDGYYYAIRKDENGDYRVERLSEEETGNKIEVITSEKFDGEGEMKFDPGVGKKETLVFGDRIDGKEFCFDIRSGEVTIYIDYDMTLTNEGKDRSAINIEPNAKLNLYVAEGVTLTVNSGFGKEGQTAETLGAKGGIGGYAGIRVPWIDDNNNEIREEGEQAELNLYGEGTVIAIGGDAGNGGGAVSGNTGGGRRWRSWSRNRWKWRQWWICQ